jgi:hypothetical protein
MLGTIVGVATPAHADPGCITNGAYVLFARGSGEHLNDDRARAFRDNVMGALAQKGMPSAWAELGNEDGSVPVEADGTPPVFPNASNEYPAVPIDWPNNSHNLVDGGYNNSVEIGRNELITHLNQRYSPGPIGRGCTDETLILGGYSQGADVVGWALRSSNLLQVAKDHIGYVALYGDPKFDPGPLESRVGRVNFQSKWWWVRGDDPGFRYINDFPLPVYQARNAGAMGARTPYVPSELYGRFGSWCADHDGVCTGIVDGFAPAGQDIHSNKYQDVWIPASTAEIAYVAKAKHDQLNGTGPGSSTNYLSLPPTSAAPATYTTDPQPETPRVRQVKRTTDHVGTYQVYASTLSTVTEAWWHPGEVVQTKEIIHISQGNIRGFDKVNEPDGTTQSLYTAVPDGVWETWWRPGDGPHSTKIVTGLTGVRQIIANPVTDGGQYTHRLYVLASDGPYEVWWREGGDGIHVNRLDIVNDPVTMTKSRGPDGTDQLYVATPTWVYELWWRPNTAVNHSSVINITQGDIRSLDKGANLPDGGQLLYTGTSTTAWQTYWNSANGTGISHGTITVGQTNAGQVKKTVYNGDHQLYQTNGCRVQENWWNGPNSGSSTLINISQCNIRSFDKSADGPDQQLYTASGDLVYETWWRGGSNPSGPNTSVLFKVAR